MQILTDQQLCQLPTHRLLALYRKRRSRRDQCWVGITDFGTCVERLNDMDDSEVEFYHKVDNYANRIKAILDTREHLE